MKKNYYLLVDPAGLHLTFYYGTRSNAVANFRRFVKTSIPDVYAFTYYTVECYSDYWHMMHRNECLCTTKVDI
jgi:hypothetical protein